MKLVNISLVCALPDVVVVCVCDTHARTHARTHAHTHTRPNVKYDTILIKCVNVNIKCIHFGKRLKSNSCAGGCVKISGNGLWI